MRCDACRKRRETTMHPLGVDLCWECAERADQDHPRADEYKGTDRTIGGQR